MRRAEIVHHPDADDEIIELHGMWLTKDEIWKLYSIVKDLSETNSYELPYRGEELISRAIGLLGKSSK